MKYILKRLSLIIALGMLTPLTIPNAQAAPYANGYYNPRNGLYTAVRGDTVPGVASALRVSTSSIIRRNNLNSIYLRAGQVIAIPRDNDHYVITDWDRDGRPDYRDNDIRRLVVLSAKWGADKRYTDVTSRLQSFVRYGHLDLSVNTKTMGSDPKQGERKKLYITYRTRTGNHRKEVKENDRLVINWRE